MSCHPDERKKQRKPQIGKLKLKEKNNQTLTNYRESIKTKTKKTTKKQKKTVKK